MPCLLSSFNRGSAPQQGDIPKGGLPSWNGDVLFAQRTKVDRLPYSNGSDSSLTPALVSTRDTVSVSFKYSVVLCLEVRVRPGLLTTRTVTMGLIDVDCHNQLLGHLPACSRSGGPSHAHIGSRCHIGSNPFN